MAKPLVFVFTLLVALAACKAEPENRACDVLTTAAPGAACHDWGRHVAIGSADVDVAFVGVHDVWQWCYAGSVKPTCETVMDLRPKAEPAPAAPAQAPAPAPVAPPAPVAAGSNAAKGSAK